jgi:ABC-type metal ion transport system substrate-binding protein
VKPKPGSIRTRTSPGVARLVKSFQSPEVKKLVDSSFGGSPVTAF